MNITVLTSKLIPSPPISVLVNNLREPQRKTSVVLSTTKVKKTGCVSEHSIVASTKLPALSEYSACFDSIDSDYHSPHTTISTAELQAANRGYQPSDDFLEGIPIIDFDEQAFFSLNATL